MTIDKQFMESELIEPNLRVLALMPHPDDIEILCAGTLIRLRDLGYEIHMATMTAGDKGSAVLNKIEIANIRRAEARKGAETIGAVSYECLEFQDLEIVFDNDARRRVASLFRRVNPGIVFTTPPLDYMFDHEITSKLVRDACFNASCKNYETDGDAPATSEIPYLFYSDPISGHDLFGEQSRLDGVVDISAQMEQKAAALACHDSQRSWLLKQHGIDDYMEQMKRWGELRGGLIGVAYGEGFTRHLGHPHPTDDILDGVLQNVINR